MYWITSKNKQIDKILIWIEDNVLDRIFAKRILKRLTASMKSGFVTDTNFELQTTGNISFIWQSDK